MEIPTPETRPKRLLDSFKNPLNGETIQKLKNSATEVKEIIFEAEMMATVLVANISELCGLLVLPGEYICPAAYAAFLFTLLCLLLEICIAIFIGYMFVKIVRKKSSKKTKKKWMGTIKIVIGVVLVGINSCALALVGATALGGPACPADDTCV